MSSTTSTVPGTGGLAQVRFAGFGIRLLAYLIDLAILLVLYVLITIAVVLLIRFVVPAGNARETGFTVTKYICTAVTLVYFIYFWGRKGATPGKKVLHLRVKLRSEVTAKDILGESGIGDGKAFVRVVGYAINGFLFYLPFLMILFTAEKRGLHDYLAGTVVIRE